MKKRAIVAAAILVAIGWLGGAREVGAAADDGAAIKALQSRLTQAVNAKDLDGIMACYVADQTLFVFDVIPPRQYVGAKAYRENWQGFLGAFDPVKLDVSDVTVTVVGDVAYGHLIQHFVGNLGGKPLDLTTRVTDVYRKTKGKWLIVEEHISVPVDLATGKADTTSKP